MTERDPRPFLIVTALFDANARPANLTMSHGDALERAIGASASADVAGLDLVELPVGSRAFAALRKQLGVKGQTVGLYDVFPLAAHIDGEVRIVAGQFLAAEAVWALEEQGVLKDVDVRMDLPAGWNIKNPKEIQARLMESGALELSESAIETYRQVKAAWDQSAR